VVTPGEYDRFRWRPLHNPAGCKSDRAYGR
jgi:hypothetical protein